MGQYADKLKAHLEEFRPNFYEELDADSEVDKYCQEKEQRALSQKETMVQVGLYDWEADEIIIRELLQR